MGCTTYSVQGLAPRIVIEQDEPARVRATLAGGQVVTVENPSIVGDSLIGERDGARVALALEEVERVEVPRDNRLWLLLVAGLFLLGGFFAGISAIVAGSS
jgi:uncharacterized small protein (DUF1192 family)